MTSDAVLAYYQSSKHADIRPEFQSALDIAPSTGVASDCGCGAGSNIAHLRSCGYSVHAFDIDEQAISLCAERFANDANVFLSVDSFGTFNYPKSSLVIADASLFFCPADEFDEFIEKLQISLGTKGVFYGSFVGERDTMAGSEFNAQQYWGDVLVFNKDEVRTALRNFDIVQFVEHERDGETATGEPHHWHIFSVVAKIK